MDADAKAHVKSVLAAPWLRVVSEGLHAAARADLVACAASQDSQDSQDSQYVGIQIKTSECWNASRRTNVHIEGHDYSGMLVVHYVLQDLGSEPRPYLVLSHHTLAAFSKRSFPLYKSRAALAGLGVYMSAPELQRAVGEALTLPAFLKQSLAAWAAPLHSATGALTEHRAALAWAPRYAAWLVQYAPACDERGVVVDNLVHDVEARAGPSGRTLKVQNKVARRVAGKRSTKHVVELCKQSRGKSRTYALQDNDVYQVFLPDMRRVYVFPAGVLLKHAPRCFDETRRKHRLHLPQSTAHWTAAYLVDAEDAAARVKLHDILEIN